MKEETDNSFLTSKKKRKGKKDKAVRVVNYMYSEEVESPFVKFKERQILLQFFSGPLPVYIAYQGTLFVQLQPNHGRVFTGLLAFHRELYLALFLTLGSQSAAVAAESLQGSSLVLIDFCHFLHSFSSMTLTP